jgi:hypothetical protein
MDIRECLFILITTLVKPGRSTISKSCSMRPIFHSGLISPVVQYALPVVVPVVHALLINLDTEPLDKVRCASHNRLGHIVHMHSRYNHATLTTVSSRELLWRAWELGQNTRCCCAGRQLPTPLHCHNILNHHWRCGQL